MQLNKIAGLFLALSFVVHRVWVTDTLKSFVKEIFYSFFCLKQTYIVLSDERYWGKSKTKYVYLRKNFSIWTVQWELLQRNDVS